MHDYKEFLNKEELAGYKNFLKNINFEKKILYLSKKYKNKKILIYGAGILFDSICQNYDLKKYLNIVAISDLRFEKEKPENDICYGYKTIKPSEIKNTEIDTVLVSTINPKAIEQFLLKNKFVKENTIIKSIIPDLFTDKLNDYICKIKFAKDYFKLSKNVIKSVQYLFVLNKTEYQSKLNYEIVLKKLRENKDKKLKVAFLCEENAKWGYQSIYDEMKQDNCFEILPVINLPIITNRRQEFLQSANIDFFKKFNMDSIDGYDYKNNSYKSLKEMKPDIVFYQQPWYMAQSQLPNIISEYALTCIISYGFTSINSDSWGSDAVRKNSGNIWRMFAESEYHNKFYQKAGKLKYKDILFTKGYPKLDNYNMPVNPLFEKLWKGNEQKGRIIWAPHYSIDKYGLGMSNFKEQYIFFLDFAKNHPEYSFVVKPHPALKYKCIEEKFMSAEEYDKYISDWNALGNATVYTDGNYFDIFKTSDVLITDSSSFLAEYFYSGKPIIFFENENRCGFNKFGKKIKKGFYNLKDTNQIEFLLSELLIKKQDRLFNLRKQIIEQEFYYPQNGIGKNIVEYLKHETNH